MKIKKFNGEKFELFVTTDYDKFSTKLGNRPIDKPLVKRIKDAITKNGWYPSSVIIVGDKLCVLDGQHRLEALKEIRDEEGKIHEIHYMVDRKVDRLEHITAMQTARGGWKDKDLAASYMALGYKDYNLYAGFRDESSIKNYRGHWSKLSHTAALILLSGERMNPHTRRAFKEGRIVVNNIIIAELYALWLKEISELFQAASHLTFINCIISIFQDPRWDQKEFIRKLEFNRTKLFKQDSRTEYKRQVEEIFNYKKRIPITFNSPE